MTEGGEYAAIEWSGKGQLLRGHHGPPLHRLPGRLRHLLGRDQPPQDRAGGEVAARAHAPVLPGAARSAARRPGRAPRRAGSGRSPGELLHLERHRRRRRRHEAGPPLHRQVGLHLLRPRLPRQVLRLALAHGQGRVPPALRAALAGRLLRSLRRRGRGRSGAPEGRAGGHVDRRGRGRAGAGRSRGDRAARRLLAAPAGDLHALRRAPHRGRGPDRDGPHREDVRGRALGRGPRHHVPGQGAGRRGHAALRLHLDPADLEGARGEPVHPHLDLRRKSRWPARPGSRPSTSPSRRTSRSRRR